MRRLLRVLPLVAMLAAAQTAGEWKPLFDGVSLKDWQETPFSGHGKVTVESGAIVLGAGAMTGVNFTAPFPSTNFELRLEAMRVEGDDFFAGITFPVRGSNLTWIVGGWGGTVVGLSSLDHLDASENDSSISRTFESNHWYALRLRVEDHRIQAWIDAAQVMDEDISKRELELRPGEIELSKPLGIASYWTKAKLRKLEYRPLAGR